MFSVLQDYKLNVTATGDTRLLIKGTAKAKLTEVRITPFNQGANWVGPSFVTQIKSATVTPAFFVNGVKKSP